MRVIIVGYQALDFTSSDGKPIKGTSLFVTHPSDNVVGLVAKKFFVNDKVALPVLDVGKSVDVYFNDKQKVDFVALAK